MSQKKSKLAQQKNTIEALVKQLEEAKKKERELEDGVKRDIGSQYVTLMQLQDKNLTLDDILEYITQEVKEKREALKKKPENNS